MQLFTLDEVRRLTGVKQTTVSEWIRDGLVTVATRGRQRGKGRDRRLNAAGVFAVVLVNGLRKKGATKGMIRPVAVKIAELGPEGLETAAEEGKVLVSAGELLESQLVPSDAIIANQSGWNEMLIAVDVATAWERLQRGMNDLKAEKAILG